MRDIIFSGHQPNFLPYMGYFYKIFKSDVFVIDDDVQFSKSEWHNFNFIKVGINKYKITIPVSYHHGDLINEVKINYSRDWQVKLLRTVEMNYSKAKCFYDVFEMLYRHIMASHEFLFDLNYQIIKEIVERLHIETKVIIASKEVPTDLRKNDRNIYQCKKLNGTVYYSGIGGKGYNDIQAFKKNGIYVVYSDYEPVVYSQQKWNFIPNLSVLDYLFNEGFKLPKEWLK